MKTIAYEANLSAMPSLSFQTHREVVHLNLQTVSDLFPKCHIVLGKKLFYVFKTAL